MSFGRIFVLYWHQIISKINLHTKGNIDLNLNQTESFFESAIVCRIELLTITPPSLTFSSYTRVFFNFFASDEAQRICVVALPNRRAAMDKEDTDDERILRILGARRMGA